jgi:hypothetical protein
MTKKNFLESTESVQCDCFTCRSPCSPHLPPFTPTSPSRASASFFPDFHDVSLFLYCIFFVGTPLPVPFLGANQLHKDALRRSCDFVNRQIKIKKSKPADSPPPPNYPDRAILIHRQSREAQQWTELIDCGVR